MVSLVDPSCYADGPAGNMVPVTDYLLHIFSPLLADFPPAVAGDVLRVHRSLVEVNPRNGKPDLRVSKASDVVLFPWDRETKEPFTSSTFYALGVEDLHTVRRLLQWSRERFQGPTVPVAGPPTAEPKVITIAVTI